MVTISILLPTRGRRSLLGRFLNSLSETTSDPQNIEIVLYMDDDDIESHDISHPSLPIVKIIKQPGNPMGRIMNECFSASNGRYIMLANDDAVFQTKNWDIAVVEAFSNFSDDLVLVYGNDKDQGENVPTFPVLSRRFCEIAGGVCPNGYLNLHIESHIFDIFNQVKKLGHNRICYLEKVIFEHLHYVTGKSQHDDTYVKKDTAADDRLFLLLDEERGNIAKRLVSHIEGKSDPSEYYKTPGPKVSLIFPVHSRIADTFTSSLDKIIKDKIEQIPFEVVIVSNLPSDKFPKHILSQTEKIRFVYIKNKSNFAKLCNIGAREARGDHLIFFDVAVTPTHGWLQSMVKTIEASKDVAVVGCKLINPRNGRIEHAGMGFFKESENLKVSYVHRGVRADRPFLNKVREFQAISKTCMLVRKGIFLKVQGFNEGIDIMEDIDLCIKIRELGMKVLYNPEAVISGYLDTPLKEDSLLNALTLLSKWETRITPDLDSLLQDGVPL